MLLLIHYHQTTAEILFPSDWSVTRRKEPIPLNFAKHTLQIKSDDVGDFSFAKAIYVLFNHDLDHALYNSGGIKIDLKSDPPQYQIRYCSDDIAFREKLPEAKTKIWTVDWNAQNFKLTVDCNGERIIDVVLSDKTCSKGQWREQYSEEFRFITFDSVDNDSMSDYYRYGDSKYLI